MGYIKLENNEACYVCSACSSVCSAGAIQMQSDNEGITYPAIDEEKCINCGLCERTCIIDKPVNNFVGGGTGLSDKAYAIRYLDKNERDKSASGGAFNAVAEYCFDTYSKCVVFGAAWAENNKVKHIAVENKKDLPLLRKSKYVQSEIGDSYIKCKEFLKKDYFVVFSGTPCQIAGLKSFLGKDYSNLFTVDVVCHGTPSAKIFELYIESIEKKYKKKVKNVTFRYKKKDLLGTVNSRNILIEFERKKLVQSARKNYYLRGFHRALFYRSCCYTCKFATRQRVSDITLGDYWSIQELFPKMIDTSGVSCALVNSNQGVKIFDSFLDKNSNLLEVKETSSEFLYNHNGQLSFPSARHKKRDEFMELIQHTDFCEAVDLTLGKRNKLKTFILDLIPVKIIYKLKKIIKK